ncbi:iron ABC transporter permease [Paraburkholderia sp. D15]|uniref:ABC transporter permease n=1 Tax=Paraburkholderia sp. D15 TaxID=2880218 RepID=UPI002479E4D2|nr:iron ABC transporter permease [Paraburkholderia sp. D15]WGS53722.1 iron ABC transporter permease [Paraburkholderia sp. D15]
MARVMTRGTPNVRAVRAKRGGSAWWLTPLFAALAVLIALPVGFVVLQAVFPLLNRGSFAHPFGAFAQTLMHADTLPLLGNTVRFGVGVSLASVALGLPLGALRGLFRLPGARIWDLLFLAPFLIPPYLAAFGWILLLQPNGYLEQLTGVNLGRFLFSFNGVVAAMTFGVFPVVYFSVSRTLAALGGRLAEVARVFGAGPWRGFMRITLPLMLPAIAASALLTFTMAIEEFGVPSALGSRAGFTLMVTSIEERFSDWPIDLPGASVLSLLLALLALAAFVLQRRVLAGRDFETQTGKPNALLRRELGRWRWPVLLLFGFVALCAAIAPLFAIVTTAFSRTLSGGFASGNLTLAHFAALSSGSDGASALGTSLALAAATALVTGGLGFVSAWVVVKTRVRGRAALDALTLLPHALPGIVVGVGLILAWNLPLWPLTPYNTWGILLLSYCCLLLPYPIRYTSAALRQLGSGLEAAARVHGATQTRVLARIVMPLVAPALISSMMIVFAVASRELVTSLLLAPSGVQTASIFIWQQFEQGSIGDGMAMGTVTLLISGALLGCGARWARRFDDAL